MTVRTCEKTRYATGAAARAELARIRRRGTDTGEGKPTRAYPCQDCHGWHLTASPVGPDRRHMPTARARRRGRPRWDDDE